MGVHHRPPEEYFFDCHHLVWQTDRVCEFDFLSNLTENGLTNFILNNDWRRSVISARGPCLHPPMPPIFESNTTRARATFSTVHRTSDWERSPLSRRLCPQVSPLPLRPSARPSRPPPSPSGPPVWHSSAVLPL